MSIITKEMLENEANKHKIDFSKLSIGDTTMQILRLDIRIKALQDHLHNNSHDIHCSRRLLKLVSDRRRLLKYLQRSNEEIYSLIKTKNKE